MKRNHRKDEENIRNTFRYKHAEAESLRTKLAGWRLKSTFLLHACHLYPLAEALLLSSEREEEHQLLPSPQHGSPKWPFKIRRQKSRRKGVLGFLHHSQEPKPAETTLMVWRAVEGRRAELGWTCLGERVGWCSKTASDELRVSSHQGWVNGGVNGSWVRVATVEAAMRKVRLVLEMGR
ncbi:hypothetical protein GW17_00037933 [Ensete ventricosum]|nr:hypothetical protein GW17_00037933 [Ensete ventricosum]